MGISELVKTVGDEHIQIQNLVKDATRINATHKRATIEFETDPEKVTAIMKAKSLGQPCEWVALVVWMPRDRVPKIN